MESNGLPTLARVKLTDLIATEGLPSDTYSLSIATLSQSLAHYSAAIIQLPAGDGALLKSCLESARLYFHHKPSYPSADISHTNDSREWCKTSGYYADPHLWQETYDYRPGLTPTGPNSEFEFPPAGLSDIFVLLGKAARDILDAISYYLNLRSSAFTEILDNVPLRNNDISSSVLSVSCHGRPSFQGEQHHSLTTQEDDHLVMFSDPEHQVDKSLLSLIKSDKAGLHMRDYNGRWVLVDGDLGPEEAIIYPGLALYQATAGYVSPALYRADIGNLQGSMCGRCSISFKLMPKSLASLNCSEMRAAGHGVESQFQLPVPVNDKKGKAVAIVEEPLDPVAEKLRQQRLVEEADYKNTAELFGKPVGNDKSLDLFIPKSESDFLEYAELISHKLRPYEKSFHYIGLLKTVMRLSMTSLKASDAKEVASSVTAIANEKLKAEKEANAGKKKTGAKKKQLIVDKPDDEAVVSNLDSYDDYDFM